MSKFYKYEIVVDAGKPYTLKVNTKLQLKQRLKAIKELAKDKPDEWGDVDIWVYENSKQWGVYDGFGIIITAFKSKKKAVWYKEKNKITSFKVKPVTIQIDITDKIFKELKI